MKSLLVPAVVLSLGLFGSSPLAAAGKVETFGKPLAGLAPTPLSDLQKSPEAFAGKTVRTEGTVAAVCTEKGCWMTLGAEGEKTVRVTFEKYSFFVPKDCTGASVTVEGVFKVQTLPEATAKHYAGETKGGKPDQIKGDQKELSLVATGVELRRSK